MAIRELVNGSEVSHRRFVWCDAEICEERDAAGAVTKRFFPQGMKVESGPAAGNYFYPRDHLGSIRELTDSSGNVRARYAYDPWGRRTKLTGDVEADFGFAGMFWSAEANLSLTHFRAYDAELGRWLSRDPLENAEAMEDPNLYVYVANAPVNLTDPLGLFGGEIVEVIGGEIVEVFGEIVEVGSPRYWLMMWQRGTISQKEFWLRSGWSRDELVRKLGLGEKFPSLRPARPSLPARSPGLSAAAGWLVGAGITVLTLTDCNTVEGIFSLYRQGNGEMANMHADKLYKEIKKYL